MITGLFETHINVTHLETSMQFYGEVLELELGRFEQARRVAFYWLGNREAMLGLWEKPKDQLQRQHFAFKSSLEAILESESYFEKRCLKARNFLDEGVKPMVFAWMPAIAIYFQDPDGHSLEFIAMLEGEAKPDLGVHFFDDWQALSQESKKGD